MGDSATTWGGNLHHHHRRRRCRRRSLTPHSLSKSAKRLSRLPVSAHHLPPAIGLPPCGQHHPHPLPRHLIAQRPPSRMARQAFNGQRRRFSWRLISACQQPHMHQAQSQRQYSSRRQSPPSSSSHQSRRRWIAASVDSPPQRWPESSIIAR